MSHRPFPPGPDSMQTFANQDGLSGHGRMTTVPANRIQVAKRRSTRIALNARIGLSGQDREKCTFTMPARATNLSRHGAAIQLNRELWVGSAVVVRNDRGTQASARVIAQVSATDQGVYTYGVEFLEDGGVNDFW